MLHATYSAMETEANNSSPIIAEAGAPLGPGSSPSPTATEKNGIPTSQQTAAELAQTLSILLQKGNDLSVHKARVEAERALEQLEEVRSAHIIGWLISVVQMNTASA